MKDMSKVLGAAPALAAALDADMSREQAISRARQCGLETKDEEAALASAVSRCEQSLGVFEMPHRLWYCERRRGWEMSNGAFDADVPVSPSQRARFANVRRVSAEKTEER